MSSITDNLLASTAGVLPEIQKLAFDVGFDHCAAAPLRIPDRDQAAYRLWCETGGAGDMGYMTRDPQKRLEPTTAFPGAKSILTLGVSYYQGPFPEKPGPDFGRVARYAWGEDYHPVILARLESLLEKIRPLLGSSAIARAVDTKPLLERAVAASAGLGFVGKNTVLIIPRSPRNGFHVGSWIFLAEILLDLPYDQFGDGSGRDTSQSKVSLPEPSPGCGGCTSCLTACPTNAFERPYFLKAERCISYLTIENKGPIPVEMRASMKDWLFGCDICQEVCPFNARALESRWPEFKAERGVGPWVSLKEIFSLPDPSSFEKKFGRTPLSRPKRRGLLRNAAVVAGNSGDRTLIPYLEKISQDADPIVSEHARWGISMLSS